MKLKRIWKKIFSIIIFIIAVLLFTNHNNLDNELFQIFKWGYILAFQFIAYYFIWAEEEQKKILC